MYLENKVITFDAIEPVIFFCLLIFTECAYAISLYNIEYVSSSIVLVAARSVFILEFLVMLNSKTLHVKREELFVTHVQS